MRSLPRRRSVSPTAPIRMRWTGWSARRASRCRSASAACRRWRSRAASARRRACPCHCRSPRRRSPRRWCCASRMPISRRPTGTSGTPRWLRRSSERRLPAGMPARRRRSIRRRKMRFGLFGSAQARRPTPGTELTDSSQGFREWIDNNVEAEALGFHSTFVVEHHFTGFGQVSASLNLLTWLGARTSTLRLGTAVLVLPWHNPVLLAEQAATLDLLSGGRLDFGVGKGYRHNEFAGFCIPLEEADARFEESLEVITKAFTSETPFSHNGRHWQFDHIVVEPPTAQKPHPPFWMGAGSPNSVREVTRRGYNMLLGQHSLAEETLAQVAQFRDEVETRGRPYNPMEVGVARAVYIATDAAEKAAAIERRYQGHMRINALARRPDGETRSRYILDDEKEARHESGDSALFGTPDEIMRKLERLRQGGVEYVIINFGGSREQIHRFARDIMPAFAGDPQMQVLAAK